MTQASSNLRGVLIMLLAVGLLAIMDAGLKQLAAHYPPLQVGALRGLASLPLALIWVLGSVGVRSLLRVRWPLHLLRGALGVGMMWGFVYGISQLPLTTAYTLFFVAPLIITALSGPVLGERVGAVRWLAIVCGLVGVLVAMRPTGEGLFTWAGLAVVGAAAGYALSALTVRVLAQSDSTPSIVFWMLALTALGAGILAAPDWVPVSTGHLWLIAGVGIIGLAGQWAITEAFARAEASLIAPIEYTALAWGLGFDLFWWGVLPGASTWYGAAIIVASGLYLIHRERRAAPVALPQALGSEACGRDVSRPVD